jgi:arginine decarboxylase
VLNYGIDTWANDNYFIENGQIKLKAFNQPALIDIVKTIRKDDHTGPILMRFPHLIEKQIKLIYNYFDEAIKEFEYKGSFHAVYPLKVNQFPNFVKNLVKIGEKYNYGLEAGSKAELLLAMSYNNPDAPITVNGFKDKEMISLGFIAAQMGYDITLIIEGLNELNNIIEIAKVHTEKIPNIGIRVRLHSSGSGTWAKSGGINSKFGLTSTELINAVELLKEKNLLKPFKMIHFHIGSQITEIAPVKKALREVGNIYAELKKMGAKSLNSINLGGGLAVEYSQYKDNILRNYTLSEYANDVVYLIKEIALKKNVKEPNIFIESGRFIAAHHAVLVAPVLELFSGEYTEKKLIKKENPPLIEELYALYETIDKTNALEFLHDSIDHMESLLTLFDLGYIDLKDRSNTEILVNLIIKKAVVLLKDKHYKELLSIQDRVQERYLVNFSIFQSMPDFWGLKQHFPVMPLDKLDIKATRSASIWDITCDSDGEFSFNPKKPLFLHDVDLKKDDYFLGFFLVGAYQEVLGMKHNLFTHPTEVTIRLTKSGFKIENCIKAQSINDILEDLDYDNSEIIKNLNKKIEDLSSLDINEKRTILNKINSLLNDNCYLKNEEYR